MSYVCSLKTKKCSCIVKEGPVLKSCPSMVFTARHNSKLRNFLLTEQIKLSKLQQQVRVTTQQYCPLLEYASPVWSPQLVKDKLAIESTQRRASRIVLGQKRRETSYEDRCELLDWSTLERRKEYFSLLECYKIVFELNRLECSDYFEFCNNNRRSNNPFRIRMKSAEVNAFKHSFFMRTIQEWNNLPHHLFGNDINIDKFKYNLKKWMNNS